jgi:hypothetical protein
MWHRAIHCWWMPTHNASLHDSLFIYLLNASIPAQSNVVFSSVPSEVDANILNLDLNYVDMNVPGYTDVLDTLDVHIDPSQLNANGSDVVGTATLFTDNAMPAEHLFQVYFLRSNGSLVDSLFSGPVHVHACSANAQGDPLNVTHDSTSTPVSLERWNHLSESTKAVFKYHLSTAGATPPLVRANSSTYLDAQIVFDVKFKIRFSHD